MSKIKVYEVTNLTDSPRVSLRTYDTIDELLSERRNTLVVAIVPLELRDALRADPRVRDRGTTGKDGKRTMADLLVQSQSEIPLVTGFSGATTALNAMRKLAIEHDSSRNNNLYLLAHDAGEKGPRLLTELSSLASSTEPMKTEVSPLHRLVGTHSRAMRALVSSIERVARPRVTVLLLGPTGAGKGLVAETIHALSDRHGNPFVKVNCAAIAPTLIESELFGNERGAFTGAERLHKGFFEQADGGTLFLDEVGEMRIDLQQRLLTVLDDRYIQRVGGDQQIPVDVRVIAATHRDLQGMVNTGDFREDLYYRLNVIALSVPPLAERREDILALVESFLTTHDRANPLASGERRKLSEAARSLMVTYSWPGNVRELGQAIESAVLLSDDSPVRTTNLKKELRQDAVLISLLAPADVHSALLSIQRLIEEINRHCSRCELPLRLCPVLGGIDEEDLVASDGETAFSLLQIGLLRDRFDDATGGDLREEFEQLIHKCDNEDIRRRTRIYFSQEHHVLTPDDMRRSKAVVDFHATYREKWPECFQGYKDLKDIVAMVEENIKSSVPQLGADFGAAAVITESVRRDPGAARTLIKFRGAAEQFIIRSKRRFPYYVELNARGSNDEPLGQLDTAVDSILEDHKNAAVLGSFGSGKTTMAWRYVWKKAEEWMKDPERLRLPLLLRLHDYEDSESIQHWIVRYLNAKLQVQVDLEQFNELVRSDSLYLVFDGFDEMGGATGERTVLRNIQQIKNIMDMGSPVLLTCRTTFFEGEAEREKFKGFRRCYVDPLNEHQIAEFCKLHLRGKWEEFWRAISDRRSRLPELAARPLFLRMMLDLYEEGTLAAGVEDASQLYAKITARWIDKEAERKGSAFDARTLALVVESLAFRMFLDDRYAYPATRLDEVAPEVLKEAGVSIDDADPSTRVRSIRCHGLLTRDRDDNFGFAHKSFVEFLVARKLDREVTKSDLAGIGRRILYEEVFEFLAQLDGIRETSVWIGVLRDRNASFIARVNAIPPLRKQLNRRAIEPLVEAHLLDIHPLVRYVCGYTLGVFRQRYPDLFEHAIRRQEIESAYQRENNDLVRSRLALLLTGGRFVDFKELDPEFTSGRASVEAIAESPGIMAAYRSVLRRNKEHVVVLAESLRILTFQACLGVGESDAAARAVQEFVFSHGREHHEAQIRRASVWAIGKMLRMEHPSVELATAWSVVRKAIIDEDVETRSVARWASNALGGQTDAGRPGSS